MESTSSIKTTHGDFLRAKEKTARARFSPSPTYLTQGSNTFRDLKINWDAKKRDMEWNREEGKGGKCCNMDDTHLSMMLACDTCKKFAPHSEATACERIQERMHQSQFY